MSGSLELVRSVMLPDMASSARAHSWLPCEQLCLLPSPRANSVCHCRQPAVSRCCRVPSAKQSQHARMPGCSWATCLPLLGHLTLRPLLQQGGVEPPQRVRLQTQEDAMSLLLSESHITAEEAGIDASGNSNKSETQNMLGQPSILWSPTAQVGHGCVSAMTAVALRICCRHGM